MIKDGAVAVQGDASSVTEESIELVYGMKVDVVEHKGYKVVVPV